MIVYNVPNSFENCTEKDHRILRMGNDFPVLHFNLFTKSNPDSLYSQMSKIQAQNQPLNGSGLSKTKYASFC